MTNFCESGTASSVGEKPVAAPVLVNRVERKTVTSESVAKFELKDVIDYLVARKFRPNKDEDFPSISRWLTMPANLDAFLEGDYQEREIYKAQLWNMSSETLATLLADVNATEYAERRAWAQLQDETKFFSGPKARADHDCWSKMPFWSLDEATALSLDKDPPIVNWSNIGPLVNDSPFAERYSKLRLIVLRAKSAGHLSDEVLPGDFVSWAEKTGVDLPTGLKKAVRAAVQRIEDRESIISERENLRAVVQNLKTELEAQRSNGESLNPSERKSLMKLTLGMAMAKFRYDPTASRSSAPKNICDALDSRDLTLDQDTVRKWLKAAASELLSQS